MKLSKPALLSAFLCPGLGHWAAGWRVTGALLVGLAVVSAGSPLVAFLAGMMARGRCYQGVWICTKASVSGAWAAAWPWLVVGGPVFVLVYVGALVHAARLRIPGEPT